MASNFLERLLKPGPGKAAGSRLYVACVAQARRPKLYQDMAVPDSVEGRFELYSLHVALLLLRLAGEDAPVRVVHQALFDAFISDLDNALRELGVGDLTVGKRMRKLGSAFYGRLKSYREALDALPDQTALAALIARTAYDGVENPDTGPLCGYVAQAHEALRKQATDALAAGEVTWPTL